MKKTTPVILAACFWLSPVTPGLSFAEDKDTTEQNAYAAPGFSEYQEHCGMCHAIKGAKKVAPTLSEVLTVYAGNFPDSAGFVDRVEYWVLNPTDSLSLLPGAILKHNRMPKLPYPQERIKSIAEWMWEAATCPEDPEESSPKDFENC